MEHLDKAGAFGVNTQGVALLDEIHGNYTNAVGLPILKLVELLRDPMFSGIAWVQESQGDLHNEAIECQRPSSAAFSVGDINYDLIYDSLPISFFQSLQPPAAKWQQ